MQFLHEVTVDRKKWEGFEQGIESWWKGEFLTWPKNAQPCDFSKRSLTVCVLEPSNHTATEMSAYPSVSDYKRSGKTLWIFSLLHFWFICRFFLTSHDDVSKQRQKGQEETEGCLSQGQLKCGQVAIVNITSKPSKNHSILERKEEKIWGSVQCCITFARHSTLSLLSFSLTHHIALFKMVPESGSL